MLYSSASPVSSVLYQGVYPWGPETVFEILWINKKHCVCVEGNPCHVTDILGIKVVINTVFKLLKVKLNQQCRSWNPFTGKPLSSVLNVSLGALFYLANFSSCFNTWNLLKHEPESLQILLHFILVCYFGAGTFLTLLSSLLCNHFNSVLITSLASQALQELPSLIHWLPVKRAAALARGTQGGFSINTSIFHCSPFWSGSRLPGVARFLFHTMTFDFGFWISLSPDSPVILWLNKPPHDQSSCLRNRSKVSALIRV